MNLRILIYLGVSEDKLEFKPIFSFLSEILPRIPIELRAEFISYFLNLWRTIEEKNAQVSQALAAARVLNPRLPWRDRQPLPGEINFERRFLFAPQQKPLGILYDAWQLQKIMRSLIPSGENNWEHLHLVITNQLIGTWDQANKSYHYRTAFFGLPSIISIPGLVEAPAKPRQFYLKLKMGIPYEILKNEFRQFIFDYEDPRLKEILKGYLLQALFYHLTGEPFCPDPSCRLYNAHWQEEMIKAQIQNGIGLCPSHLKTLNQLLQGEIEPAWLINF